MKKILVLVFLLVFANGYVLSGNTTDFTPHGTQPGLNFNLNPVIQCQGCHKENGPEDKHFTPYSTWTGSMKAHAGRDPLFWAALDVANNDIPGVGDFCFKCHAPQGWFAGHVVKPVPATDPPVDGANGCELVGSHIAVQDQNNDYSGVTCHFCHRIDEQGPLGEPQILENASIWLDDVACSGWGEPCRKGPYDYQNGGSPPHPWQHSTFIQKSEICGSCHDVSSPTIKENGIETIAKSFWHNGVETQFAMPIERTYSEWQQSYYADLIFRNAFNDLPITDFPVIEKGEQCQGCHMPDSQSVSARACVYELEGSRTGDLPIHQFAGGNSWMLEVLKGVYGDQLEMNVSGTKEALDLTRGYALNMLQVQSADVKMNLNSQTTDLLDVDVKVTNLTGHKLPTGYPEGRRMWIHVEVLNGSNAVIWESGAYDEVTGVLTEDEQIKIYESLQGIWNPDPDQNPMTDDGTCEITDGNGDKKFHFVLNNCIAKDNRIPPLGFRGASEITLEPVGGNYPVHTQNPDQLVNYDVTNYQVPITGESGPFKITATLKYQTASKDYVEFLDNQATNHGFATENQMCNRSWTVGPADQSRGAFMKSLWENYNRSAPVDMVMDFLQTQ
ncbi:MAG: hypothetical protein KDI92_10370 [Xanthomonadales bacterium]|nr:hypothetical protein [Xanthomonadales bacterium]